MLKWIIVQSMILELCCFFAPNFPSGVETKSLKIVQQTRLDVVIRPLSSSSALWFRHLKKTRDCWHVSTHLVWTKGFCSCFSAAGGFQAAVLDHSGFRQFSKSWFTNVNVGFVCFPVFFYSFWLFNVFASRYEIPLYPRTHPLSSNFVSSVHRIFSP